MSFKIRNKFQRHHLWRMAAAYFVAAWLLLQVADILSGLFSLPEFTLPLVGFLLLLGFIPALVLSWMYDLSPGGGTAGENAAQAESASSINASRINTLIIIGLSLAVTVLLTERWLTSRAVVEQADHQADHAETQSAVVENDVAPINPRSIAVLPFDDFSPERDQGWFADGLAEELLSALTRVPDLMVASRTGSFRFRGTQLPVEAIGEALRVAHIVEGSVRRSGDTVRVTVQLIRTDDDRHVWADSFDGTLDNVISIQEDIALAIASALSVAIEPDALRRMVETGTRSVEAYEAFLRGQELGNALVAPEEFAELAERSRHQFERAIEADPSFARAHYNLALQWMAELDFVSFNSSGASDPEQVLDRFVASIDAAIEHADNESDRLHYQGISAIGRSRFGEARQMLANYLDTGVNDLSARFHLIEAAIRLSEYSLAAEQVEIIENRYRDVSDHSLVTELYYRVGRAEDGARVARSVVERDPTSAAGLYHAHRAFLWAGQVDEARSVYERYRALDEFSRSDPIPEIRQACAEGRRADAQRAFERLRDGEPADPVQALDVWHAESLLVPPAQASRRLAEALSEHRNLFGLSALMLYPHFDPTPFPELQALMVREGIERPDAVAPPFACSMETA
jgi:TolB-like protein